MFLFCIRMKTQLSIVEETKTLFVFTNYHQSKEPPSLGVIQAFCTFLRVQRALHIKTSSMWSVLAVRADSPLVHLLGKRGAVSVYNSNYICASLPLVSCGREPQSSFNSFTAASICSASRTRSNRKQKTCGVCVLGRLTQIFRGLLISVSSGKRLMSWKRKGDAIRSQQWEKTSQVIKCPLLTSD